jgi:hypothetical protein|tara:strand:- start:29 stop:154 length:126 start_codon:yes stop_codon:yes gene_type:complete
MRGKGKKKAMGMKKKAKGKNFANTPFGKKVMKKKTGMKRKG